MPPPPPSPFRNAPARATRLALVLALAAAAACGGDRATGPGSGASPDVAQVMVTGAPASTMLVGDSVRLAATALNATGGVISNQPMTWKSSDPAVAAVSTTGMVVALGAGSAVITATSNGHDGTSSIDVRAGGPLGTQGGTLTAGNGALTLSVPAGGLAQSTLLLVRPAANAPQDARVVANAAYEIGPDGVVFQRAATLTIKYDASKLPAGTAEASLQLYALSAGAWTVVRGSTVDATAKTVTGSVTAAGVYAVRSTPVERIALSGAAVGGALYVGQTAQLATTLFASNGDSLVSRPIAWTSSDPGKAAVDTSGRVSAVSAGTVTLTAAVDGKAATASLTVLARPVADWSRAGDWTTFQGNPQHSGYIAATLDPGVFQERWVSGVAGGAALNQPTTGDGRVYVSTSAYFGKQQLYALNPADGSQQWLRDFGAIFGINQPTYAEGSVYMTTGGHGDTFMYALNAGDGGQRFKTAFNSQWEHWRAPVVVGQVVLTAGGYYGGLYGFDVTSGKQTFFKALPQVDGWAPGAANGVAYYFGYDVGGSSSSTPVLSGANPSDGSVQLQVADSRLPTTATPVVGGANEILAITGNRLVAVDLSAKRVLWEQSGSFTGVPAVAGGVVYAVSGTQVAARRESDGSALWSWGPPATPTPFGSAATVFTNVVVTNNLLFVGVAGAYGTSGTTYAIDLATHLQVWSYPGAGEMALSGQGVLYINLPRGRLAAITVR